MKFIFAVICGAISVAAFEPLGWAPLAVASLVGLFFIWNQSNSSQGFWTGFGFGLGQFGIGVSWVYVSLHVYGFMPPLLAALLVAGFAIVLSLFPAAMGALQARFVHLSPTVRTIWIIPVCWILGEWLRGWVLTGFPWLQMGTSQVDWPLGRLAGGLWWAGR